MAQINNSYRGLTSPNMDAYLRNLNEFRVRTEVDVLPVLGHFITNSESSEGRVFVPSRIIQGERRHLEYLRDQYFKRDFELFADPSFPKESYDVLAQLIRKTRKATDYAQLDLYDFMAEHPNIFKGIELPVNVAISVNRVGELYHHDKIDPERIEAIVDSQPKVVPLISREEAMPQISKYQNPFQLYFSVLSDIKRTCDFELLKMYDFLIEQGSDEVRSTKLVEILDDLVELGEREYYKQRFAVKVVPFNGDSGLGKDDLILDQWASNLRRIIELKDSLTSDLIGYLSEAPDEELFVYRTGAYPELFSLLHARLGEEVPEEFRRLSSFEISDRIG